MLKFISAGDLARLSETDPAHPIISDIVKRLITDTYDRVRIDARGQCFLRLAEIIFDDLGDEKLNLRFVLVTRAESLKILRNKL